MAYTFVIHKFKKQHIMKNISLLIIIVILTKLNCFGVQISDTSMLWTIAKIEMGNYVDNSSYSTIGDTMINSTNYTTIYHTKDSIFEITNSEYFCAFREFEQKWYFVPKGQATEFLMYDFSLNINDTVVINNPWVAGEIELIAFDIEIISLNGVDYKKLSIGYYDSPSSEPHILEYWIEGIGCTHGLFYSGLTFMDLGFQLLCYHENEEIIYLNSPDNTCGYIKTTELSQINASKEILLYPNPATDIINIENNGGIESINILSVTGKILDVININSAENLLTININSYPDFFIIKIIGDDFVGINKVLNK